MLRATLRPATFAVCAAAMAVAVSPVRFAAQGLGTDYRQWRGEHRDGAAAAFSPPASWPDTLTRQWTVTVGEGYATPLVVGNTVFVFTRQAGNETMVAVDAATGAERWHSGYPAPYSPGQPAAAHGAGPKATPVYQDGRLFTMGISGIVSAFDAVSGKILWQTPPPAEHPFFGAASSPLAEAGLVIVHPGNYEPLTAFDRATGTVKWRAGTGGFFSSPIVIEIAGTRQIVSATLDSVVGVSLDGRLLWRHPWDGGSGSTTPVTSGGLIIVSGLDRGVTAIKPTRRGDSWSIETVWKTTDVSMYLSTPVVVNDTLFGLSHKARGQYFAIDAKSGAVLWLGAPRTAENTAVLKAGDLLFLLNADAELIVAKGSLAGFEPVARYRVGSAATWAQPVISGNRIFVKDVTSLSLWTIR
jgi:outer membrane protein assembly factor BamB